jgi:DNA-binding MarR family transcriptional regulator
MSDKRSNGFWLFLISRAFHNLASKVFREIGLYRGQPPVLTELGKQEGITQSELAERLELTQATMTNLLNRLEASGFIHRQRNSRDSRCSNLYLSEAGKEKLAEIRKTTLHIDQVAFNGFTAEEEETLNGFLKRIHKNLVERN